MKIEYLFFNECPNHEIGLKNLKDALNELGIQDEIILNNIRNNEDVINHKFLGSPSIRLNDKDLEYGEKDTNEWSMNCRRYSFKNEIYGYPPKELILECIRNLDIN